MQFSTHARCFTLPNSTSPEFCEKYGSLRFPHLLGCQVTNTSPVRSSCPLHVGDDFLMAPPIQRHWQVWRCLSRAYFSSVGLALPFIFSRPFFFKIPFPFFHTWWQAVHLINCEPTFHILSPPTPPHLDCESPASVLQ